MAETSNWHCPRYPAEHSDYLVATYTVSHEATFRIRSDGEILERVGKTAPNIAGPYEVICSKCNDLADEGLGPSMIEQLADLADEASEADEWEIEPDSDSWDEDDPDWPIDDEGHWDAVRDAMDY